MSRLKQLSRFGQSIWIDYISRRLLTDGGLQRLIMEEGLRGLTSNPAIFEKAIAVGTDYREALIDAVSRIDTMVDAELEEQAKSLSGAAREQALSLRGRAAIASAKLAYQRFRSIFSGADWDALKSRGAAAQRLLWASTSTKNPAYPDTLYVDELIGPDTVNTLPPATLDAFRDHGRLGATLEKDLEGARETMRAIAAAGISLEKVTGRLLEEGVRLFAEAYDRLLDAVRGAREAA